jgi:hypothetical protein
MDLKNFVSDAWHRFAVLCFKIQFWLLSFRAALNIECYAVLAEFLRYLFATAPSFY